MESGNGAFMSKKVLILRPDPAEKGGVSHYYGLVQKHFVSKRIHVEFFSVGKRPGQYDLIDRVLKTVCDMIVLCRTMSGYDLIVVNPSLDAKSFVRDGVFHVIAKRMYRKKTVVFFRGWLLDLENTIDRYGKNIFRAIFNSDKIIVLCERFKEKLVSWGVPAERVITETTTYENHEIEARKSVSNMVFLSRFTRGKGALEAIKTVEILTKNFPNIKLYMVGDGELSTELKNYVVSRSLNTHVIFTSWLAGEKKYQLLEQCGIMLYPTDYGEGMPNSILEGMGAGLAIISRPVAGIADILVDGENGYLIHTLDPADFAAKVTHLLQNRDVWQAISATNRKQAKERFEIRSVVQRLERLFLETAL